jgi:hypothetical protein
MINLGEWWLSSPVLRSVVHTVIGALSYPGLALLNIMKISGAELLVALPPRNVLFVSNHKTYFNEVIAFPQGTTRPHAPGRKGTAHIIKQGDPIVVPVVARGFDRVFDKKGLIIRKIGEGLSVTFKKPLVWAPGASPEAILDRVMDAIEETEWHWSRTCREA